LVIVVELLEVNETCSVFSVFFATDTHFYMEITKSIFKG